MTTEERITEIKKKVESLVNEAIEILETNYDLANDDTDSPVNMIWIDLNSALIELDDLDDENLKIGL